MVAFVIALASVSVIHAAEPAEHTPAPASSLRLAPTAGPARIIGETASGCLSGAKELPQDSTDYILVRPSRLAYFGTPALIIYAETLAKRVHADLGARLIVEDLSRPRGGPYAAGHGSHQTGLDVDISLTLAKKSMTLEERESFVSPSFVTDRKILKSEWSDVQTKIVSLAADVAEVDRIFVAPAIKKYFCEKFPKEAWLYKLRAWWGHDDHIHVRLRCPADQPECKSQPPLNKADPCGKDQQWWHTTAADKEWQAMQTEWTKGLSKTKPKSLPAACTPIL